MRLVISYTSSPESLVPRHGHLTAREETSRPVSSQKAAKSASDRTPNGVICSDRISKGQTRNWYQDAPLDFWQKSNPREVPIWGTITLANFWHNGQYENKPKVEKR